jgi:Thaumarchaeal output domain 1
MQNLSEHAVFIRTSTDWQNALQRRAMPGGHVVPVINLSSEASDDCDCNDSASQDLVVEEFRQRQDQLMEWVKRSSEPEIRLLAYVFMRAKPLRVRYEPNTQEGVGYGRLAPVPAVRTTAERLANAGLLSRTFFDRLHVCDRCSSARMSVREECASCRGANLKTTGLLHHFRCAYQGPEFDFRRDDDKLICPKCSRELSHYGTDHEHSGTVLNCLECGSSASDALIGFVCMDCTAHFSSEAVGTVDYFHYELTDAGKAMLLQGSSEQTQRFALGEFVPLAVVQHVNRLMTTGTRKFALGQINYARERIVIHDDGAETFDRTRGQLLDNLRARLNAGGNVFAGRHYDFVLLVDVTKTEASTQLERLLQQSTQGLTSDLGPYIHCYDSQELLPCLN